MELSTTRRLLGDPAFVASFPLMITAWGRRPGDRRSGELSAGRAHARRFPVIERDGGKRGAHPCRKTGIVCLPIAMRAELAFLRVDLNTGRANHKPH